MRFFKGVVGLLVVLFMLSGCAKKVPEKIGWVYKLEEGKQLAQKEHKGLIVEFFKDDCPWCKRMDDSTFVVENVRKLNWNYVFVKIDGKAETTLVSQYGITGYPTSIVFSSPDKELDRIIGYLPADSFEIYVRNYEKGIRTLAYYEKKVAADSSNVELIYELAEKYKWHNRPQEALAYFYKIVALDPPNVKKFSDRAVYEAADLYFRNKDYKGALGEFGNLMEKYPDSEYKLDAELMVAYCYGKLDNKTTALGLYKKFLKEHPGKEDEWVQKQIDKLEGRTK
ncbi:MAG: thioredoxin fold domain-containing protein [candidate division Zixibacteria bacterium]|nr:thioredoxin fold domain-containing protein [candidate division Zixibacteria bacterium]